MSEPEDVKPPLEMMREDRDGLLKRVAELEEGLKTLPAWLDALAMGYRKKAERAERDGGIRTGWDLQATGIDRAREAVHLRVADIVGDHATEGELRRTLRMLLRAKEKIQKRSAAK